MNIRIENGRVSFVYDDALRELLDLGPASVLRASHVEPARSYGLSEDGWVADMAPSGGGVLVNALGRAFPTRAEALDAERAWLTRERGL